MKSGTRTIAVSALLTGGIVFADYGLEGEWPPSRQMVGLTVAFFIIAATADIGLVSTASMFALLLLIAVALQRGEDLLDKLTKKVEA